MSFFEEESSENVCIWTDKTGTILGSSAGTRKYFKTSKLQGHLFTDLVQKELKGDASFTFPPLEDEVIEGVSFKGRRGVFKSDFQICRVRDKNNSTLGFTVTLFNRNSRRGSRDLTDALSSDKLPEGYLLKKASLSSNKWQKRYFRARKILRHNKAPEYVLDYFPDYDCHVAKGSIKLQGTSITTNLQPLVLDVNDKGRHVYLKAQTPATRWEWANALHKLAEYGLENTEEVKAEIQRAKEIRESYSSETPKTPQEYSKPSWREKTGRHGGKEGFQISDLARIAKNRMSRNKLDADLVPVTPDIFSDEAFQIKYFNIQVLSGRGLKVKTGTNAPVVVKFTLKGPRSFKQDIGQSERGYGPSPVFGTFEPTLCKQRKLHNILAHVRVPSGVDLNECDLHMKVYEYQTLREVLIGDVIFSLEKLQPEKIMTKWFKLYPLNKVRGDIKVCMYFENPKKLENVPKVVRKPSLHKKASSTSSFGDFPSDQEFENNFDPFAAAPQDEKDVLRVDEDQLAEANEEISALNQEVNSLRAALGMLKEDKFKLEAALNRSLEEKEKAKRLAVESERKRSQSAEQIQSLEVAKANAEKGEKKANAEMMRRLILAKKLYTKEIRTRKEAEARLAKLRKEMSKNSTEAESAALSSLSEEMKGLQSKLDQAEKDHSSALAAKQKAEDKLTDVDSKLEKALADLKVALERAENAEKAVSQARQSSSDANASREELKQELESSQNELHEAMARVSKLETKLAAALEEVGELKALFVQAEMEISRLRNLVEKLEQQIEDLQAQSEQAISEMKRAKDEAKRAELRAKEAEAQAKSWQKRAEAAEKYVKAAEAKAKADAALAEAAARANAAIPRALRVQLSMYARYFNAALGRNAVLIEKRVIPLAEEEGEWAGIKGVVTQLSSNGFLLASYLNFCVPNALDIRAMHAQEGDGSLEASLRKENLALVAHTCKSVGVAVGRVSDLAELLENAVNRPSDIADFLFALVSFHVLRNVLVERCAELTSEADEATLERLAAYPTDLLSAWVPHHVHTYCKASGSPPPEKECLSLPQSWANLVVPCLLVSAMSKRAGALVTIRGGVKAEELGKELLRTPAGGARFEAVSEQLQNLGASSASSFLSASRLDEKNDSGGDPSVVKVTYERANILFSAALLDAASELVMANAEEGTEDTDVAATTVWINNLGIKDLPRVHDLFHAVHNGLLLLRVLDSMSPGCVNWKKAEMKPNHKIKRISNCALAIDVAKKNPFAFSLVGVGGNNIYEGNRKLTLSLLWQMRRYQLLDFLGKIFAKRAGSRQNGGAGAHAVTRRRGSTVSKRKRFDESILIEWANSIVETAIEEHGLPKGSERVMASGDSKDQTKIQSMRDESLSTSMYYLLMLWATSPWAVNWKFVSPGATDDQRILNARYAITVARKLGVSVFVLPEDLVELRPNMILVFMGGILGLDRTAAPSIGE